MSHPGRATKWCVCHAVVGTSNILSLNNSIKCIPDPGSGSSHTGLIVGLAVGIPVGLLILLLAAAAFWLWRRRRKRSRLPSGPILPVSVKGNGVDPASPATASGTPHTSGNSGQTSYTGGSATVKLATEHAAVDAETMPLQPQKSGLDAASLAAGSAASAGTALGTGIPPQTGSEMKSVARIRFNDTLEVASLRWHEHAGSLHATQQPQMSNLTAAFLVDVPSVQSLRHAWL